MPKIFCAIYSYRDLELSNTVEDLLAKADKPEDLVIGVINADDEDYTYKGKYNVKVKNVPYKDYNGCGRANWEIIEEMYNDEDYYFRLDPHCRFKQGWDTYYKSKSKKKRVVWGRCLNFYITGIFEERNTYTRLYDFHPTTVYKGREIPYTDEEFPVIFMQACGIFAPKEWVKKVGYDPHIAYWGEEMDLSMRTWLAGFEMWHTPSYVYHLWGKKNRKGLDTSNDFTVADRLGQERVKMKLGLREMNNENVSKEWNKYGCDGHKYKELVERSFQ